MNWALNLSFKEANNGIHPVHHMGAVIIKGGRVISKKANMLPKGKNVFKSRHAEERAMAIRNKDNLIGATIVITRRDKRNAKKTMSKPCPSCYQKLLDAGIKKIIYINWNNEIIVERLKGGHQ